MTLEALLGTPVAFDQRIHAARPHIGQGRSPPACARLLAGSEIRESHVSTPARAGRLQPALHAAGARRGARRAALRRQQLSRSRPARPPITRWCSPNRATCSPAATSTERRSRWPSIPPRSPSPTLAGIAERRIDRLVNPDLNQGLPAFLAAHPGVSQRLHDGTRHRRVAAQRDARCWRIRRASITCRPRAARKITCPWE